MIFKKLLQNNPKFATKLLEQVGKKNALKAFRNALKIKAYKDFLKSRNINYENIKTFEDFTNLPVLDKSNYIKKYPLQDLLKYSFSKHYTIERSSGYTGKPHYWPRISGQDDNVEKKLSLVFDSLFKVKSRNTLVINTFALGTWLAGTKFARFMLNFANRKDIKMTVINVGINLEEALEMLKRFYKYYDQTIIVGYNPFIKELLEKAKNKGFPFNKHKINLLIGGEGFSEEWRDYIAEIMTINIDDFDAKVISGYGAADMGSDLGFEQPVTIFFRRLLVKDKKLRHKIFGKKINHVPVLFQYSPTSMWTEVIDGELIFTADNAIPLIRYNLHDNGGIIPYQVMIDVILEKYSIDEIKERLNPMPLPLIYLYGRSDGTIQVWGANVYIEQVREAIYCSEIREFITGRFYIYVKEDSKYNTRFVLVLETDLVRKAKKHLDFITDRIVKEICYLNTEYKSSYNANPDKTKPYIKFVNRKAFSRYRKSSIKVVNKK